MSFPREFAVDIMAAERILPDRLKSILLPDILRLHVPQVGLLVFGPILHDDPQPGDPLRLQGAFAIHDSVGSRNGNPSCVAAYLAAQSATSLRGLARD